MTNSTKSLSLLTITVPGLLAALKISISSASRSPKSLIALALTLKLSTNQLAKFGGSWASIQKFILLI